MFKTSRQHATMMTQRPTAFPLRSVSKTELKALCQTLWDWPMCSDCKDLDPAANRRQCRAAECFWGQRSERLELFFGYYREITGSYVPDFFGHDDQALRSHQDLFDIISLLRVTGNALDRDECRQAYFNTRFSKEDAINNPISLGDQERAFNLAATVMTMVKTSSIDDEDISIIPDEEHGRSMHEAPFIWQPDQTLQMALLDTFPNRIHPSLCEGDAQSKAILSDLTAANLTRIAKLKFQGTSDLRHHLKLDPLTGTVQIFHHTTFLKEHLLSSKRALETQISSCPPTQSTPTSNLHLPRPLLLETLLTLQTIFPISSPTSQRLLRNLVSKSRLDLDMLRFGTTPFELLDEKQAAMQFPVWGTRMMDLYDEIENPKPRGVLDAWLERRSKSRHVMMVTIAGVSTAVVLGVLGLAVSCFQAWIAWRDWREGRN